MLVLVSTQLHNHADTQILKHFKR